MEKMKSAMAALKSAMAQVQACMGPDPEGESVDIPDQEMGAEEGDYDGKGLMAKDKPPGPDLSNKKQMAMAMLRKRGY